MFIGYEDLCILSHLTLKYRNCNSHFTDDKPVVPYNWARLSKGTELMGKLPPNPSLGDSKFRLDLTLVLAFSYYKPGSCPVEHSQLPLLDEGSLTDIWTYPRTLEAMHNISGHVRSIWYQYYKIINKDIILKPKFSLSWTHFSISN